MFNRTTEFKKRIVNNVRAMPSPVHNRTCGDPCRRPLSRPQALSKRIPRLSCTGTAQNQPVLWSRCTLPRAVTPEAARQALSAILYSCCKISLIISVEVPSAKIMDCPSSYPACIIFYHRYIGTVPGLLLPSGCGSPCVPVSKHGDLAGNQLRNIQNNV